MISVRLTTARSVILKLTGNQLFFLTHIGVLIWAAVVVWLAVVTKEAAIVALFFAPVLWLR